jgi:hypothetical protein
MRLIRLRCDLRAGLLKISESHIDTTLSLPPSLAIYRALSALAIRSSAPSSGFSETAPMLTVTFTAPSPDGLKSICLKEERMRSAEWMALTLSFLPR